MATEKVMYLEEGKPGRKAEFRSFNNKERERAIADAVLDEIKAALATDGEEARMIGVEVSISVRALIYDKQ